MARMISTFAAPYANMTLKALAQRQKALDAERPAPQEQLSTVWGGAGHVVDQIGAALKQRALNNRLAEIEGKRADIFTRVGDGQPSGADIGELMSFDPETAIDLWTKRQERIAAEQKLQEQRAYDKTVVGDERTYEGEQARIKREQEVADAQAKIAQDNFNREDQQKAAADLAAANRENWRPATPEELAKYPGIDTTKGYEVSDKTGQVRAIGGGGTNVTINPPSAEVAAKLGLTEGFLENYDTILEAVTRGDVTGPIDVTAAQYGHGAGADAYGYIKQGTEGLSRLLTGAGMPVAEANDRARQYEPTLTDTAQTLAGKLARLKVALHNAKQAVITRDVSGNDPTLGKDPATPAPAEFTEGQTATGPGGQKIIFRGGQWVPQ